ncbi:radical SAM/SPASM domain-containing protein [Streptomyces noursei]|uniref:radical SAM/SPASM domain-containing protein n=1 Tax=Streptomyces noursei TaxID=1971 RepID=UPI00344B4D97
MPPATTLLPRLLFAWLEVTLQCNEHCVHCFNDSGPHHKTHGTMDAGNWCELLDQLRDMGVRNVQFIGGEPALNPDLPDLIAYARHKAHMIGIEVFTNLTYVPDPLWAAYQRYRVRLATSYYSDDAAEHDHLTQTRGAHARTRANIIQAQQLGIPVRAGVIRMTPNQRITHAEDDLRTLGVADVAHDDVRAFGRATTAPPKTEDLCGHCGRGKVAITATGDVLPCTLARHMPVGNLFGATLADIYHGPGMAAARAELAETHPELLTCCTPPQFLPSCGPANICAPDAAPPPKKSSESGGEVDGCQPKKGGLRYYNRTLTPFDC